MPQATKSSHFRITLPIFLFLVLPAVFGLSNAHPIDQQECPYQPDYLGPIDGIDQSLQWRYHSGDDLQWADPAYDDTAWPWANPFDIGRAEKGMDWTGIGWFRAHIQVDSILVEKPLALVIRQLGASEIYLDGRLLYRFGTVSSSKEGETRLGRWIQPPSTVEFEQAGEHLIAVRYSNHQMEFKGRFGELTDGFSLHFGDFEQTTQNIWHLQTYTTSYQMFFFGLPLAFCLIHFLLFVYYPKQKENLYFAGFALSMGALTFFVFRVFKINDAHAYLTNYWFFKLSILGLALAGMHFVYSLFSTRYPKQILLFGLAAAVLVVMARNISQSPFYYFAVLTLVEQLRVVFRATYQKRDGAWIIALGYIIFTIGAVYQMAMDLGYLPWTMQLQFSFLWGFLGMLVAMSLYLARSFARTNMNLERQIKQVRDLSARAIEQERQAKLKDLEHLRLEEENKRRQKELEEIRKRQLVLEELEVANRNLAEANHDLRETQSQLVQSEKMASLGVLVAGVAHEINTPVGAMSSSHDTLVRALDKLKVFLQETCDENDPRLEHLQKLMRVIDESNLVITSGGTRVTNIVRRLKSFARLDEAELKKVDIHEGLEDTLTIVHHELKHRAEVVRDFGEVKPVACFPGQLNQVYLNLLVNAVQAMPEKGTITIRTRQENGQVMIQFTDTGAGIPEQNLAKIFDPGFTTKGVGVGTGLGLSICYKIIQDHRGKIEVESVVGEGSTFTITFPDNLDSILEGT